MSQMLNLQRMVNTFIPSVVTSSTNPSPGLTCVSGAPPVPGAQSKLNLALPFVPQFDESAPEEFFAMFEQAAQCHG
ncbi:hypothetical protein E2C01_062135 [Portunus trituberculatus]|uniref:Uncharacterized protein n=1 Tax=Portunus trituberculatus TaxID=210409 RepID=A0A5B7HGA1_PORTR|nr:hypothetical protein [Portunus trituberculatus]